MAHTFKGRTVEEAVANAVQHLGTTEEQLVYEVIEQPQKGFFGLFGGKPAVIKAHVPPRSTDVARSFLEETISLMGLKAELSVEQVGKEAFFSLHTTEEKDQGRLIGRKGQTLDSLEYLTNLAASHSPSTDFVKVRLDAGGYRHKREETLKQLALRISHKAKTTKEPIVLEPMPARERKVIHTTLANDAGVQTHSQGEGAKRHVVVEPTQFD
ncbi:RNA-binding cell elongation regulator Jag/EloR [Bacillus sp. FSL W8-1122]